MELEEGKEKMQLQIVVNDSTLIDIFSASNKKGYRLLKYIIDILTEKKSEELAVQTTLRKNLENLVNADEDKEPVIKKVVEVCEQQKNSLFKKWLWFSGLKAFGWGSIVGYTVTPFFFPFVLQKFKFS